MHELYKKMAGKGRTLLTHYLSIIWCCQTPKVAGCYAGFRSMGRRARFTRIINTEKPGSSSKAVCR